MKWVKSGDAGTKNFHAHATLKHRRNLISTLEDSNGVLHTNHQGKADTLWNAYKERLGIQEFQTMAVNLTSLYPDQADLSSLEEPFTCEEIDLVFSQMPSDKSPGPDGFNTDFIKKCWPIIKADFYALWHAFQ